MKVIVDFETCESHGTCVELVPEVFDLKDLSLVLLDPSPDESLRALLEEAVRLCPTESIFVIESEDNGGEIA